MIWLKHFCPQMEKKGQTSFKTLFPGSQYNAADSETSLMLTHPNNFTWKKILLLNWLIYLPRSELSGTWEPPRPVKHNRKRVFSSVRSWAPGNKARGTFCWHRSHGVDSEADDCTHFATVLFWHHNAFFRWDWEHLRPPLSPNTVLNLC